MSEVKTHRPFQQRLIDSFDRSKIRQEVLRSRQKHLGGWRRRYGSMMLGASLAIGGMGIPLAKANRAVEHKEQLQDSSHQRFIGPDLAMAREIARQVTGGVEAAAETAASVAAPVKPDAEQFALISAKAREDFFRTDVPFGKLIYEEALKNDLDPALVAAVVETESRFQPTAKSHAGAQGLMQLVPRTGKWMGAKNLMNPAENVRAGTKYLKYLNERFDGNERKVLAAYNAGEGNVKRYGGIPPFKETQSYVKKVQKAKSEYQERSEGKVAEALQIASLAVPGTSE